MEWFVIALLVIVVIEADAREPSVAYRDWT